MAKKIEQTEYGILSREDIFTELMKDTSFTLANDGSKMMSGVRVKTPLYVLNCIWGGGIPLAVMSEISGMPAGGKSTFLYQCMGNFQRQYPDDGVAVIIDMETSMDNSRLKALGVDVNKVLRLPATSLEDAFANIFKMLNKLEKITESNPGLKVFIIYDSLSSGGTNKQHASVNDGGNAFNAGSMMEAPRIIKQNLANIPPYLEKFPVYIGLINQVFSQIGMYQTKVESSQQFGLKHFCHFHITFGKPSDVYENGFLVGTESSVDLKKSKLSPKIVDIPCYIDVTKGGIIDEVDSFVKYLIKPNIGLIKTGSWYQWGDKVKNCAEKYKYLSDNEELNMILSKNYRKDDMYALIGENKDICNLLQILLIDLINEVYPAQEDINHDYKMQLISECSYFKGYNPDEDNDTEELLQENINSDEIQEDNIELN